MTNWRDIPDRQRVRVTLEAVKHSHDAAGAFLTFKGALNGATFIDSAEADAATWEIIDPPLKVGPAEFKVDGERATVLALHEEWAWVKTNSGLLGNFKSDLLRNIEEGE